jgi:hypothetical protein
VFPRASARHPAASFTAFTGKASFHSPPRAPARPRAAPCAPCAAPHALSDAGQPARAVMWDRKGPYRGLFYPT